MFNRQNDNFDIKNIFYRDEFVILLSQAKCYSLGKTCYDTKRKIDRAFILQC